MEIDEATIRDLIGFSDEIGVLSFYVTLRPDHVADQLAATEIRNRLRRLIGDLARHDKRTAMAVKERVAHLDPDLQDLLNPSAPGRGRALFVAIKSGQVMTMFVQMHLASTVVHDKIPWLRPLLEVQEEGRPSGVLEVARSGIRLLSWSVGEAVEVFTRRFVPDERSSALRAGSRNSDSKGFRGDAFKDRLDDHVEENYHRFLRGVIPEVAAIGYQHHWDRIVIGGSPRLRERARELLNDINGEGTLCVVLADQSFEHLSPHEIAEQVWPLLKAEQLERERTLIQTAVERALAGGPGAVGLRSVCQALNEGRVAHLFFQEDLEVTGFRSDAGTLHPDVGGLIAASGIPMHLERKFVDRMAEAAITSHATATPVTEDVTVDLRSYDGVVALLRW